MKIKQKNFLITTILLIGSLFVFSKAQAAVQNITSCGSLDTISTTYVLQNDVISDGQCFNINANNIVLDLNGHTVTYNNVSGDEVYGITTNWNRDGIRITNGTIRQGIGNGYQSDVIHPLQASNVEIDHLNIYYQGENVTGIEINGGSYAHDANVHDNMIYPNSNKRTPVITGDLVLLMFLPLAEKFLLKIIILKERVLVELVLVIMAPHLQLERLKLMITLLKWPLQLEMDMLLQLAVE